MALHRTTIQSTRDRTYIARCSCGWQSGDNDTAREANEAADAHEQREALNEAQHQLEINDNG